MFLVLFLSGAVEPVADGNGEQYADELHPEGVTGHVKVDEEVARKRHAEEADNTADDYAGFTARNGVLARRIVGESQLDGGGEHEEIVQHEHDRCEGEERPENVVRVAAERVVERRK